MQKWILKALVQKTISLLPAKHALNYWFQKNITKGVVLSGDYFIDRLIHARIHLNAFKEDYGHNNIPSSLEIGTGWYPVVPVSLYLAGCKSLYTTDLSRLLTRENLLTTLRKFTDPANAASIAEYLPVQEARMERLKSILKADNSLENMLAEMNLHYWTGDARQLPLDSGSIAFITSNNTFEHIEPAVLEAILQEFSRGGDEVNLMSHFIDMSDHFSHFDPSITNYHFLHYSKAAWRLIDNSIQPQNRLRLPAYKAMYERTGLHIRQEDSRPGSIEQLLSEKPHADFMNGALPEIAKTHSYLVSVRGLAAAVKPEKLKMLTGN